MLTPCSNKKSEETYVAVAILVAAVSALSASSGLHAQEWDDLIVRYFGWASKEDYADLQTLPARSRTEG